MLAPRALAVGRCRGLVAAAHWAAPAGAGLRPEARAVRARRRVARGAAGAGGAAGQAVAPGAARLVVRRRRVELDGAHGRRVAKWRAGLRRELKRCGSLGHGAIVCTERARWYARGVGGQLGDDAVVGVVVVVVAALVGGVAGVVLVGSLRGALSRGAIVHVKNGLLVIVGPARVTRRRGACRGIGEVVFWVEGAVDLGRRW